jgi:nucleotide-binding universal stress UspA family protein
LREKQEELTRAGLRVKSIIRFGMPARVILALAQEYQAGLIILASRGHGWLGRLVLGSVTRTVVSESAIPVFVVRRFASVPAEETRTEPALALSGTR